MIITIEQIYLIILYIFIVAAVIQLFYYLFFFIRIIFYKKKDVINKKQAVSVIITAKNEAENLQKFLPTILEQKYSDFEVIVVNDASEDNSNEVLDVLKKKYKNLYVTTINKEQNFSHGKKLAQTIGIKAAKNEWLLFTDADCIVSSEFWLEQMQQNFSENTNIVLGYGGYIKTRGLLNKLIRYDTVFIALQYLSFAISGIPYMGVGRNLAYRRSMFFKNRGFASHLKVMSGSDDLFINENANKSNTKIEISKESFTHSISKKTFSDWVEQKKRHFSTGKYYKFKHKIILSLELLSREFFYILFIFLAATNNFFIIILPIFAVRLLIYIITFSKFYKTLNEKGLYIIGIFFDFLQPILNFIIFFLQLSSKKTKNKWT